MSNIEIADHNDLQILKVSFLEEKLKFEFWVYWWLSLLLSVVSDQTCSVFPDNLFLYLDKCGLYLNLRSQWSPDCKRIIFGRKAKVWIASILVATFVALSGQWSGMQGFPLIIYFSIKIIVRLIFKLQITMISGL